MSSSPGGSSPERDYFSTPDELLKAATRDPDVRDKFAGVATVVDTEQRVFEKTEKTSLCASLSVDTEPLPPDEYNRATTDQLPFAERFADEPTAYDETRTPFVEHGVSPSSCPNCRGTGAETCLECRGDGEIPCTDCNTTGNTACQTCSGTGERTCTTCDQSGQRACVECHGAGTFACPKCEGDRKIPCSCVDQPGEVGEILRAREEEQRSGASRQSRHQSTRTRKEFHPCQHCRGDGTRLCGLCDGNGAIDCSRCGGSKRERCPDCRDGWQRCPDCRGQSDQSCSTCAGKGSQVCPDCTGQREHPCEECARTGELYYARHGAVEYTTNNAVEWEHSDTAMGDTVGHLRIKQIKQADGTVVQSETTRPESAPSTGEQAELRRRTETVEVPAQTLTYDYKGETGTIVEIDGDIESKIVTAALTERGRRKRQALKLGTAVFMILLVAVLLFIVFAPR